MNREWKVVIAFLIVLGLLAVGWKLLPTAKQNVMYIKSTPKSATVLFENDSFVSKLSSNEVIAFGTNSSSCDILIVPLDVFQASYADDFQVIGICNVLQDYRKVYMSKKYSFDDLSDEFAVFSTDSAGFVGLDKSNTIKRFSREIDLFHYICRNKGDKVAYVLEEPLVTLLDQKIARGEVDLHSVFVDSLVNVIAVSKSFYEEKPQLVEKFLTTYYWFVFYNHQDIILSISKNNTSKDVKTDDTYLSKIKFPSSLESYQMLKDNIYHIPTESILLTPIESVSKLRYNSDSPKVSTEKRLTEVDLFYVRSLEEFEVVFPRGHAFIGSKQEETLDEIISKYELRDSPCYVIVEGNTDALGKNRMLLVSNYLAESILEGDSLVYSVSKQEQGPVVKVKFAVSSY